MILLQQVKIRRMLSEQGAPASAATLRQYLIRNHEHIRGLRLIHHENVDKNGRNNHWYEIASNATQERANRLVAEQFIADRNG